MVHLCRIKMLPFTATPNSVTLTSAVYNNIITWSQSLELFLQKHSACNSLWNYFFLWRKRSACSVKLKNCNVSKIFSNKCAMHKKTLKGESQWAQYANVTDDYMQNNWHTSSSALLLYGFCEIHPLTFSSALTLRNLKLRQENVCVGVWESEGVRETLSGN